MFIKDKLQILDQLASGGTNVTRFTVFHAVLKSIANNNQCWKAESNVAYNFKQEMVKCSKTCVKQRNGDLNDKW